MQVNGLVPLLTVLSLAMAQGHIEPQTAPTGIHFESAVVFSDSCSPNAWIGYLRSRGEVRYEVAAIPEFDAADQLAGWVLRLSLVDAPQRNILEPKGTWHGLQPWHLMATDFQAGADASAFGVRREILVSSENLRLVVMITDVKVVRTNDTPTFSRLALSISVDSV